MRRTWCRATCRGYRWVCGCADSYQPTPSHSSRRCHQLFGLGGGGGAPAGEFVFAFAEALVPAVTLVPPTVFVPLPPMALVPPPMVFVPLPTAFVPPPAV